MITFRYTLLVLFILLSIENIEAKGGFLLPKTSAVNPDNPVEAYIASFVSVDFYDPATGKIMMTLMNNSIEDVGYTSVKVDRNKNSAGICTVPFWNDRVENALAAKTYLVHTQEGRGDLKVILYYSDEELSNWESATGNTRKNLQMLRVNEHTIASVTPTNNHFGIEGKSADLEPIGGDYKVIANFKLKTNPTGFGIGRPGDPNIASGFGIYKQK